MQKLILKKWGVRVWTGFMLFGVVTIYVALNGLYYQNCVLSMCNLLILLSEIC